MGYVIKGLCLLLVIIFQVMAGSITTEELSILLLLVALYIVRSKYMDHVSFIVAEVLLVFYLSGNALIYLALYGATAFDLAAKRLYVWIGALILGGVYYLSPEWFAGFVFLIALSSCAGYLELQLQAGKSSFLQAYDRERQSRYALEETKGKLLKAAAESAHLAEIKERNRIAREIHDSIGHELVGNLLQLQAAAKIMDKQPAKTRELLQKSVEGLAGSVELLRSTVHNIRPREQLGWSYFEKIIDSFKYCPVRFIHAGDFNALAPEQVEILASIIKEALTNTARHSAASLVEIQLEVREQIIRLYIKDNGSGCERIQEGMGISGMRERVNNAGGNLSITATEGFMIVCVLPRDHEHGGVNSAAQSAGS